MFKNGEKLEFFSDFRENILLWTSATGLKLFNGYGFYINFGTYQELSHTRETVYIHLSPFWSSPECSFMKRFEEECWKRKKNVSAVRNVVLVILSQILVILIWALWRAPDTPSNSRQRQILQCSSSEMDVEGNKWYISSHRIW